MPLQVTPNADTFVQVADILVDSGNGKRENDTNIDFVITLPEIYTNIVALSIPEFHVPLALTSPFTDANYIDFQLLNTAIYAPGWKTFVAVLPEDSLIYQTPTEACYLCAITNAFAVAIASDPDFGGKVDIVAVPQVDDTLQLLLRPLVGGFGNTRAEFLFGTGANFSRSAGPSMGFDEEDIFMEETTVNTVVYQILTSPRPFNASKFTFVDVTIDQFPEFRPFLRVFTPADLGAETETKQYNGLKAYLLTETVRSLRNLSVHVRLKNNIKPQANLPIYFTVRLFYLYQDPGIPEYAKNRIQTI
jgi:hypothetical protein